MIGEAREREARRGYAGPLTAGLARQREKAGLGYLRGKAGQAVLVTRSWDELGWKGPQRARPAETERAGHGKKAKKGRERVSSSFF